jgi:cation-transporting P-type ATPase I
VAGSRPDRVIQRPHLVLLDGARIVTDGLELCHAIPLHDERDSSEWLALAAGVAVAAGSPWGKGLAHVAHEAASEGAFDGTTATAAIGSRHYTLQPMKNSIHFPQVARFRNRGEYVLQLSDTQTRQPLALIVLYHS